MIGCLFSGYGGLSMAVGDVLGMDTAWHAEVEPAACRVLAHHWPDVPNLGDVSAVDWTQAPEVDVITAGFPCQDLSYAGKGAGIKEGTRSGLWTAVAAAVRGVRPRLVVLENVAAIVARRPGLDVVLADLAALGYDATWTCLRAADVGAPHGRDRWFLVGNPTGRRWGASVVGGRGERRHAGTPGGTDRIAALLPTPAVNDMGAAYDPESRDAWTAKMRDRHGNGNGHGKSLSIEAQRLLPTPRSTDGPKGGPGKRNGRGVADSLPAIGALLPTPTTTERGPDANTDTRRGASPNLHNEVADRWGDYADAIGRWEPIVGRPAPDPTEPGKNGKPRLSPRFVEWMMGLPEGHVCDTPDVSRTQALKMLGNGVVVQQASEALRRLLSVSEEVAA